MLASRSRIVPRTAGIAILGICGCASPTETPPPSGGSRFVLSFEGYRDRVAPVLARHGCDAGGDCHGGGIRGTLELSPSGAKDDRFDFEQVALQVKGEDPGRSPLLTKPLAGEEPHAVEPFTTPEDPDYRTILAWIEEGAFE